MTSSTKPEVHSILHCCQSRIEPPPPATCTENFVKLRRFLRCDRGQTYRQTDPQTDMLITIFRAPLKIEFAVKCRKSSLEDV